MTPEPADLGDDFGLELVAPAQVVQEAIDAALAEAGWRSRRQALDDLMRKTEEWGLYDD